MKEFGFNREEREALQAELRPEEEVLWAGKPVPRLWDVRGFVRMASGCAFLAVFFLVGLYEDGVKARPQGALSAWMMMAPFFLFVVILIAFEVVRMWRRKVRLLRSVYAVTNRRCLALRPGFWGGEVKASVWGMDYAECRVKKDGSGDIVFRFGGRGKLADGFVALPDVSKVKAVIDATAPLVPKEKEGEEGAPPPAGRISRHFLAVFFLVSIALLAAGAYTAWDSYGVARDYARASGRVTALRWESHTGTGRGRRGRPARTAKAVFEYRVNGVLFRECERSGHNPPSAQIGEAVEVLYNPGNPAEARINGFMAMWFMPTLLGAMGLFFAIITALAVGKAHKEDSSV